MKLKLASSGAMSSLYRSTYLPKVLFATPLREDNYDFPYIFRLSLKQVSRQDQVISRLFLLDTTSTEMFAFSSSIHNDYLRLYASLYQVTTQDRTMPYFFDDV